MKLRIKGDSVRLRLTRSEVDRLMTDRKVSEAIRFGPGANEMLTYSITVTDVAEQASVSFNNGQVNVDIGIGQIEQWAKSDAVGIDVPGDPVLFRPSVLIEKDFACKTQRPDEDESDMFDNPSGEIAC